MDKQNLENLKKKLENEKSILEAEVKQLKIVPDFGSDVDSGEEESDESTAYGNQLALMESFKERVADIELALDKMKKNKYGICEKCGKEISIKVLEASPESRLCQMDKQKEKVRGFFKRMF